MPSFKDFKGVPTKLDTSKNESIVESVTHQIPKEPPSFEALNRIIKEFSEQKKEEHKMLDYLLLSSCPFIVQSDKIIFKVNNDVQIDQLSAIKSSLGHYIKKLSGYAFVIEGEVDTNAQENTKLYTASDKFAFLSQKYPALLELKQKLGLELDM